MLQQTKDAIVSVMRMDPSIDARVINNVICLVEGGGDRMVAPSPIGRVLSRQEVAKLLGVSVRTVSLYSRRGVITPVCLGNKGKRATGYTEESIRALSKSKYHE